MPAGPIALDHDGTTRLSPQQVAHRGNHQLRKMQAGARVTYYITGTKKTVKAYESAKLVEEWEDGGRDENVAYYLAKLDELAGKFEAFVPASAGGDRLL